MAEPLEIQNEEAKDPRWLNCEPVSEEAMNYKGSRYTPCEILREIYRATNDEAIKLKCRIASRMFKAMAERICKHEGRKWGRSQYPWNPNRRHQRTKAKYDRAGE